MSVTNNPSSQKTPSLLRREQVDSLSQPQQPQLDQGAMPLQAGGAQAPEPVGAYANDDSETFEVSMDDWFKA
jgi:hypothetical protein